MNRSLRIFSLAVSLAFAMGTFAQEARYIFYFICDGVGMGHVMGAEAYNRTRGADKPIAMMRFPVASQCTTRSASSPVTDSAAAGTALATGHKTRNSMLGLGPDSTVIASVAYQLKDRGYGVGIITTEHIDDATPAAFYAHVVNRHKHYEIGCDAARCGFDFIGGLNLRGAKDTDLYNVFADNDVKIFNGLKMMPDTVTGKVVVLEDACHYALDSVTGGVRLLPLTQACMKSLENNGHDKWFIMIEGGNIDHAAHANDAGAVFKEIINLNDEAISMAYDFYLKHPDETLIVVTADHETGGLALGNNDLGYNTRFELYDHQRISKEKFTRYCHGLIKKEPSSGGYSWDDMCEYLKSKLGFWEFVPVSDEDTSKLHEMFEKSILHKEGVDKKTLYADFDQFTEMVYHVLDKATGVGWTSNCHTAGMVPVYAIGVGAEKFSGMNDNTDIPTLIMSNCMEKD